ncbi:MAG: alpha-galactosidase, partial [Clostridiales bacterium]|nr:alpha-galactosidase [Clostridiales bacterium]
MSIIVKNKQFHLSTANKSYIFSVYQDKFLTHIYWGDKLSEDIDVSGSPEEFIFSRANAFHVPTDSTNSVFVSDLQLEFSVTGGGDYRTPSFLARYADGSTVSEFSYDSYCIYKGKTKIPGLPSLSCDNTETLEVTLADKKTGLTATLYYCVLEDYDVITRYVSIKNGGEDDIHILSAQSACVDFYGQDYKIMNLQGDWARERNVEYTDVKHGIFTIDSKRGMSSHMNNPFTAIMDKNANEDFGEVYAFCLVYSGNFDACIEGSSCGTTRVNIGINPYNFDWTLKPGEEFFTPEAIMVHSGAGLAEMSRVFHRTFRECLYQGEYKMKERPLIINNWEGTSFNFDEPKLCAIAETASKLGLEMFVLDDGWFGKRNDDRSSLGDWYLNKEKLPAGLASLADKVNGYGMKFGLWVEPEMISPDSDLYRSHPDWCLHAEGRTRTENRQQLVLDFTRKEVRDYIIEAISDVIESANIEYIKWDCNRNITETQNQ